MKTNPQETTLRFVSFKMEEIDPKAELSFKETVEVLTRTNLS